MSIHPHADVHPDATLGEGVEVGAFATIAAGTVVGDRCRIGPHATIHPHTTLGAECRVHAGAVIGDWPQDLAFTGVTSFLKIGEGCVFREGVTVHRGTQPDSITRLGNRCYLMANSHVAHNCTLGDDVIMGNNTLLAGYVEVGDRVFLSGNCVVHQFCRIGQLAMMSGLSAISKDLPPYCVVQDLTSNTVAALNVVGMRRADITPKDRAEIKRAFHLLYKEGLNVKQAIEQMKKAFPSGPAAELWQFAQTSKRGICAGKS